MKKKESSFFKVFVSVVGTLVINGVIGALTG
jgi:hypothetical protein